MTPYEVPLTPQPQRFTIALGEATYQMQFQWCKPAQCWMLDLRTEAGEDLMMGAAIVTGVDILGQYPHLGIPGALIAQTDHDPNLVPTFENLGTAGRLYFVTLP